MTWLLEISFKHMEMIWNLFFNLKMEKLDGDDDTVDDVALGN